MSNKTKENAKNSQIPKPFAEKVNMILRFGCSNHASIREFQEVSFLALNAMKELKEDLVGFPTIKQKVLKVAAIYGANASGKSNLLNSLHFIIRMISSSHRTFAPGSRAPHSPFALDKSSAAEESKFEIDFVFQEIRYSFGFSLGNGKVVKEFLYAFPKSNRQVWYSREINKEDVSEFQFGRALKGRNSLIAELTRDNSLFLSAAAQQGHVQLSKIFKYLTTSVTRGHVLGMPVEPLVSELFESNKRKWVLDFLQNADFGIEDVQLESTSFPPPMRSAMKAFLRALSENSSENTNDGESVNISDADLEKFDSEDSLMQKSVRLGHKSADGGMVFMPWDTESDGTRRLLSLLVGITRALERGGIALIDELDASLHTVIVKRLIELFKSTEHNPNGAQLVFTTHDTNILCSGMLRRDEIYFVEKDRSGRSIAYSLADFPVRATDNFEKGYLEGRFGAIPFVGRLDAIAE